MYRWVAGRSGRSVRPVCQNLSSQQNKRAEKELYLPEELVNIIISDNVLVTLFASHEFPVDDLITLVPDEPIKRFDSSQAKPFGNRLHPALALWRPVIVVCTLENEAKTLGSEPHLRCFGPAEKVKRNLPKAVVLAHIVHPSIRLWQETSREAAVYRMSTLKRFNPRFGVCPMASSRSSWAAKYHLP